MILLLLSGCGSVHAQTGGTQGPPATSVKSFNTHFSGSTIKFNLKDVSHKGMGSVKNRPKETVVVHLPLYPKATKTHHSTANLYDSTPRVLFLKEARKKYSVPSSKSVVEQWYKDTFTQNGYTIRSSGTTGNINKGVSSTGITFQNTKDQNLTVIMGFERLSTNKALVQYDVQYISTPVKEVGSTLPKNLTKVIITYHPRGALTSQKKEVKAITNSEKLTELRTLINGLKPDVAGGMKHCALYTGQGADLKFLTTDHKTFDVTVKPACANVYVNKGQALSDRNNGLWTYVTHLFSSPK